MKRPHIPNELKRRVLFEAGHRCAIPTCKNPDVDVAHIIPFERVLKHTFDNLITLCPNCHRRYDRGQIDRQSMLMYKARLSVESGRYMDFEKRIVRSIIKQPDKELVLSIPRELANLLMENLLSDGILQFEERTIRKGKDLNIKSVCVFRLTDRGKIIMMRFKRVFQ